MRRIVAFFKMGRIDAWDELSLFGIWDELSLVTKFRLGRIVAQPLIWTMFYPPPKQPQGKIKRNVQIPLCRHRLR